MIFRVIIEVLGLITAILRREAALDALEKRAQKSEKASKVLSDKNEDLRSRLFRLELQCDSDKDRVASLQKTLDLRTDSEREVRGIQNEHIAAQNKRIDALSRQIQILEGKLSLQVPKPSFNPTDN